MTNVDQKKLEELRGYYDNTDTSAEMGDAELDNEVCSAPMVGITVRLPAERLERVRQMAAREGTKTTALIRRWIEENVEAERAPGFGRAQPSPPYAFFKWNLHTAGEVDEEAGSIIRGWLRSHSPEGNEIQSIEKLRVRDRV